MRFLVRNNRPRKPINLFGRILRAGRPSKQLSSGEMWLEEDQVTSYQVQKLLEAKRLVIVRVDGLPPGEIITDEVPPVDGGQTSEPTVSPGDSEVTSPIIEPVVEEPVPEDPTPMVDEDDETGPDTMEELLAMGYRELQQLAKDLDLPANGSKDELAQRIYDYQHGGE